MKRLHLATCLFVFATAQPVGAEALPPNTDTGMPRWHWQASLAAAKTVRIDLVHADITILPARTDDVTIDISSEGKPEDAARMWLDLASSDAGILLQDRFPRRPPWALLDDECLPPSDERGDYWLVPIRLRIVIRARPARTIDVSVKNGTVSDQRSLQRQTFRR